MNVTRRHLLILAALSLLIFNTGCSDRNPTELPTARANVDPVVFDDFYSADVYYQAFFETNYEAVSVDSVWAFDGFAPDGARSLKITIPARNSALGPYSGGVITSVAPRHLADFNALTFYARADTALTLDLAGFGNDNTGNSIYEAGRNNIALTTDWALITIPIPGPGKLISERGLFAFAEGWEDPNAGERHIWLDEIKYAKVSNFEVVDAKFDIPWWEANTTFLYLVGSQVPLRGGVTSYEIDGDPIPVFVNHSPFYFNLTGPDSVVSITKNAIRIIGAGEATITATLEDGTAVSGQVNLIGYMPPTVAAASPTLPAADVMSLFSDTYQDINVDDWNADWGQAVEVSNYSVAGNPTKMYTDLTWAGIMIKNPMMNITDMTHFHADVFAPEGTDFSIEFVSFIGGSSSNKLNAKLTFNAGTTPAFSAGSWAALEIPLADFNFPAGWDSEYIGEMVISSLDSKLVLVDNLYFHK